MLKQFHTFEYEGKKCVINIDDMSASVVDVATAKILKEVESKLQSLSSLKGNKELRAIGLIKDNKITSKSSDASVPICNLSIFITQTCNLKCVYCYGNGGEYGSIGSMTPEIAERSIEWLIEKSGKNRDLNVCFFGGEPLLNFQLMKHIVGYASKRGKEAGKKFTYSITTNASLLDDQKIAFMKDNKVSVLVSFDGPKQIQDKQRPFVEGNSSYEMTVPKIKKLLEALPETECRATLLEGNDPNIVKNALNKLGFSTVHIAPVSVSLFDKQNRDTHALRNMAGLLKIAEKEAEQWIALAKKKDAENLKKIVKTGMLNPVVTAFFNNDKKYYPCGAGLGMIAVSCAGDIFLCHRFVGMDQYKLGTVFDKDLKRDPYLRSPIECVEKCSECFARYFCAGGCKHDNAGSCGSVFFSPEDTCSFVRSFFELAAYTASMLDNNDRYFMIQNNIITPKPCPFDF